MTVLLIIKAHFLNCLLVDYVCNYYGYDYTVLFRLAQGTERETMQVMGFPRSNLLQQLRSGQPATPGPSGTHHSLPRFNTLSLWNSASRTRVRPRNATRSTPTQPQAKAQKVEVFQKPIHVFDFDPQRPSHFTRKSSKIVASGLLPPIPCSGSEESVRSEIVALVNNCSNTDYNFPTFSTQDFEFVQMVGKVAQIPTTRPGFRWDGTAVKHLAGQGSVYIRLTRSLRKSRFVVSTDSDESDFDFPDVSSALKPSVSTTSVPSTSAPAACPPTSAPTQSQACPPTYAPTQSPTSAPAQSQACPAASAPTQSPTQSPTSSPAQSQACPPTSVPTQSPTSPAQSQACPPTSVPTQSPASAPVQSQACPSTSAPTRSQACPPPQEPGTSFSYRPVSGFPVKTDIVVISSSDTEDESDLTSVCLNAQKQGSFDDLCAICSQTPKPALDIVFCIQL